MPLVSATELLVPVDMSALAFQGLGSLMETVGVVRQRLNSDLGLPLVLAA